MRKGANFVLVLFVMVPVEASWMNWWYAFSRIYAHVHSCRSGSSSAAVSTLSPTTALPMMSVGHPSMGDWEDVRGHSPDPSHYQAKELEGLIIDEDDGLVLVTSANTITLFDPKNQKIELHECTSCLADDDVLIPELERVVEQYFRRRSTPDFGTNIEMSPPQSSTALPVLSVEEELLSPAGKVLSDLPPTSPAITDEYPSDVWLFNEKGLESSSSAESSCEGGSSRGSSPDYTEVQNPLHDDCGSSAEESSSEGGSFTTSTLPPFSSSNTVGWVIHQKRFLVLPIRLIPGGSLFRLGGLPMLVKLAEDDSSGPGDTYFGVADEEAPLPARTAEGGGDTAGGADSVKIFFSPSSPVLRLEEID